MCEIAVVDPEQCSPTTMHQIAAKFNEEQGDGLGVLAVKHTDDGFEYSMYKSVYPDWQTLYAFIKRNLDDTWRFVIHGRAGTCGGVNREAAHPIHVDCDKCEFDYVVHNGSVRKHRKIRPALIRNDHEFTTSVDSEILAHKVSELPNTVEKHNRSTYSFTGNLNYLLFSENGILVRVSSKYHLTDDVTMTCSLRAFDDYKDVGFERDNSNEWMLITPGDDEPEIETKERVSSYNRSSSANVTRAGRSSKYGWGGYTDHAQAEGSSTDEPPGAGDIYVKEYTDHVSQYDYVSAIKVAPGIMEIIDHNGGKNAYVYRDSDPRLYYWYAPEDPPENIERLEELADKNPYQPGQTNLLDFASQEDNGDESGNEDPAAEAASEASARVIAEAEDEVTMEEAAEIADDVEEKLRETDNAIQETIGG